MSATPAIPSLPSSSKRTFTPASSNILTPQEALGLVQFPPGRIQVQGIVSRIVMNPEWANAYGDIRYGEGTLGFSIPREQAPAKESPIVLEGSPRLRARRNATEFHYEIQIVGRIVGTFEPHVDGTDIALVRERPRLRLTELADRLGRTPNILILASDTARNDIQRTLESSRIPRFNHLALQFESLVFHPAERCADAIREQVARARPDAIIVTRGGGAEQEVAASANAAQVIAALLETGIPYYSAVGHEHDMTLLDKFSDESFHTPPLWVRRFALRKNRCMRASSSEPGRRDRRRSQLSDSKTPPKPQSEPGPSNASCSAQSW